MKKLSPYLILVALACALLVATAVFCWHIYQQYFTAFHTVPPATATNRGDWGVMGDYFGGTLGPILNGVTVCMLVIGFLFQHRQLTDSKKDATAAQRQVQTEHKLLMKQSFEQTFFAWLHSYRDIVNTVRIGQRQGKEAISMLIATRFGPDQLANAGAVTGIGQAPIIFSQCQRLFEFNAPFEECPLVAPSALAAYDIAYDGAVGELDTLLRTLYRLIRWVHLSNLSNEEKFDYIGIIRSQVSATELLLVFLNGLTERGAKFLPLIERYALFDNFDAARRPERRVYDLLRAIGGRNGARYTDSAFNSDLARQKIFSAAVTIS